jgi:hypothetical protein
MFESFVDCRQIVVAPLQLLVLRFEGGEFRHTGVRCVRTLRMLGLTRTTCMCHAFALLRVSTR